MVRGRRVQAVLSARRGQHSAHVTGFEARLGQRPADQVAHGTGAHVEHVRRSAVGGGGGPGAQDPSQRRRASGVRAFAGLHQHHRRALTRRQLLGQAGRGGGGGGADLPQLFGAPREGRVEPAAGDPVGGPPDRFVPAGLVLAEGVGRPLEPQEDAGVPRPRVGHEVGEVHRVGPRGAVIAQAGQEAPGTLQRAQVGADGQRHLSRIAEPLIVPRERAGEADELAEPVHAPEHRPPLRVEIAQPHPVHGGAHGAGAPPLDERLTPLADARRDADGGDDRGPPPRGGQLPKGGPAHAAPSG